MKTVEAIIRSEKVADVRRALAEKGITSMTLSNVMGRGEEKEAKREAIKYTGTGRYDKRSVEVVVDLFARTRLMMVLDDDEVNEAVKTIVQAAKTGEKGDGIVLVRPVEKVVRIRTGETIG